MAKIIKLVLKDRRLYFIRFTLNAVIRCFSGSLTALVNGFAAAGLRETLSRRYMTKESKESRAILT